jgi:hypothetical protein
MSVVAREASIEGIILIYHAPRLSRLALLAALIQKLVD